MKISTKGRYALRIMVDLTQQHSSDFIPLRDVAKRQDISEKYSEMIVGLLVKSGFVFSSRGKGGGYKLARPAEKITVGGVLKAVEGSLAPVSCLETPDNICPRASGCVTLPMWRELERRIDDYLEGVTIADLANQSLDTGSDYCI